MFLKKIKITTLLRIQVTYTSFVYTSNFFEVEVVKTDI